MKILFTYNARLFVNKSGVFFCNDFNPLVIKRYKLGNACVKLILRQKEITAIEEVNLEEFCLEPSWMVEFVPDFGSVLSFIQNFRKLDRIIKKSVEESDLIIARMPSTISKLAIKYARKYKKPYLLEVVGDPWNALWNHSFEGKLFAPYAYWSMKNLIWNSPYVIYVTTRYLQMKYPNRKNNVGISDVIIGRSDHSTFQNRILKINASQSKNDIILGTIGGLDVGYKGQEFVIRSIPYIIKSGFQVKYFLLGRGTGKKLRKLVQKMKLEDNVIFLGQIPFSQLSEFYKEIDIYIQPSLHEGSPRSVVEAMSVGCPCIGSKAGGIGELLDSNMILTALDPITISSKIIFLWRNCLEKQANRNFQFAKKFEFEHLNKERNRFFEDFFSHYFPYNASRLQIQG